MACRASTHDALTSSIVSINARVNIPKVAKNKAKNPVRIFCPKEKSRSIAQTTSGTLLKNDAKTLADLPIIGWSFVVFVPSRLKKNAHNAAHTVTATDRSAVSVSFVIIFGKRDKAFSSGSRFFAIQTTALGIDSNPPATL